MSETDKDDPFMTGEDWLLLVFGILLSAVIIGICYACSIQDEQADPEPEPHRDYSRMPTVEDETEAERLEHEELTRKTP